MSFAAIILAGGRSRRMGHPKPFLSYDGISFLERCVDSYRAAGADHVCAVLNAELFNGVWDNILMRAGSKAVLLSNSDPDLGRSHSLRMGLSTLPENIEYCFFQNVDNPFIEPFDIRKIFMRRDAKSYAVPTYNGEGGHPVLLNKNIIREALTCDDQPILRDFLRNFKRKTISIDNDSILVNMNTPNDYHREMIKRERQSKYHDL